MHQSAAFSAIRRALMRLLPDSAETVGACVDGFPASIADRQAQSEAKKAFRAIPFRFGLGRI